MIKGLGCDVCAISRMQKALEDSRFTDRFFTEYERGYIGARKNAAQTAAGIFAAKEAFVKALGTGFGPLGTRDIGIRHNEKGAPYYETTEKMLSAMAEAGAVRALLSVSHDGDTAMAVCILDDGA